MKIDLTCPIEVTHTEVLSDDRGRCRGYLDIINVSEHPIRRMEGHARWLSETGALLSEVDVVFERNAPDAAHPCTVDRRGRSAGGRRYRVRAGAG